ncbi:hypothetical protein BKA56DRAFT_592914 [Ilyonectria sp. MPI-CAGE-AT-0026]|nr:hypothetical protein BKA56DRAFT_592914 [Ilyonectria sp. MPI-CAGE-AT-0026]
MRSRYRADITSPIPGNLPSEVVVAFLQTFTPIIRHNPGMVSFEESPSNPSLIENDPYFGPWDNTVRAFEVREVIQLAPGLRRETKWPIVFQCVPNGALCRVNAPGGIITWTQWTVRPLSEATVSTNLDGSPGATASLDDSPGTMTALGEEWELYGETHLEANSLMIPFIFPMTCKILREMSGRIVDEVFKSYFVNTP